jgi:hypothetical protein
MDSELTRQPQQLALPKLLPFGGNSRFQREREELNHVILMFTSVCSRAWFWPDWPDIGLRVCWD